MCPICGPTTVAVALWRASWRAAGHADGGAGKAPTPARRPGGEDPHPASVSENRTVEIAMFLVRFTLPSCSSAGRQVAAANTLKAAGNHLERTSRHRGSSRTAAAVGQPVIRQHDLETSPVT